MQYKTMILDMLRQRSQMHDQLRQAKKLLSTMEQYARELKTSHQAWQELLAQMRPGSDPSQIRTEALELALKEMEDRLPAAFRPNADETVFLDATKLFLRHTPPA